MKDLKKILWKRLSKAEKHIEALKEYKSAIDKILIDKNIFSEEIFNQLDVNIRALLDAYLKRFSSLQDYLGAKIFPLLLELAGLSSTKMSDVISFAEKEGIIDSINDWIILRQIRNELEHDYPDELTEALDNLNLCLNSFQKIERYYLNAKNYSKKFIDETI